MAVFQYLVWTPELAGGCSCICEHKVQVQVPAETGSHLVGELRADRQTNTSGNRRAAWHPSNAGRGE